MPLRRRKERGKDKDTKMEKGGEKKGYIDFGSV